MSTPLRCKEIISLLNSHGIFCFWVMGVKRGNDNRATKNMDRNVIMLLAVLCCMVSIITTRQGRAAELELLTPPAGAIIIGRTQETHLVLRQAAAEGAIQVRVEKTGAVLDPVVSMDDDEYIYLHFRIPIERGENNFTILPNGRQFKIEFQQLQALLPADMKDFYLFHQNTELPESCTECHDLMVPKTLYPVGLTQETSCRPCHKNLTENSSWLHSTTVNQQCLSCHLQSSDSKPSRIGFREGRIDATCLACHTGKKEQLTKKFRHSALIGGCTLCHNPHGSNHRYQLWAEGTLEICVTCHQDKPNPLNEDKPMPYIHGIMYGKGCVACHDPHASDNPDMLLKPINELCVSCHHELEGIKRGHPVARHPVSAPSEKRRPDRKLTCVGCHNPHSSPNRNLLIETLLGGRLCRVCHKR